MSIFDFTFKEKNTASKPVFGAPVRINSIEEYEYFLIDAIMVILEAHPEPRLMINPHQLRLDLLKCGFLVPFPVLQQALRYMMANKIVSVTPPPQA